MTPSTYIHKVRKYQPYFFWQKSKQQPFPFCPLTSNNMFDPVEIESMNTDHNKSPAGRERRSEAHWREKSCRALPTLDCKTCKWLCRFNFSQQMLSGCIYVKMINVCKFFRLLFRVFDQQASHSNFLSLHNYCAKVTYRSI